MQPKGNEYPLVYSPYNRHMHYIFEWRECMYNPGHEVKVTLCVTVESLLKH